MKDHEVSAKEAKRRNLTKALHTYSQCLWPDMKSVEDEQDLMENYLNPAWGEHKRKEEYYGNLHAFLGHLFYREKLQRKVSSIRQETPFFHKMKSY